MDILKVSLNNPSLSPEQRSECEGIITQLLRETEEWKDFEKEYAGQVDLALQADRDLMLHGKSAVIMEGNKITEVISPLSEKFPQ